MYIQVSSLPTTLQNALASVGFHRKDISVSAKERYDVACAGGDGMRGFTMAVNLATGEKQISHGSWGGANMFNPNNAVDLDTTSRELPEDFAIVKGHEGGSVYASVYVHPSNLQKFLPAPIEISEQERSALRCCAYKSGYRAEAFNQAGLGIYGKSNPVIQSLAKKGLVKISGTGISLTTEGKNAR